MASSNSDANASDVEVYVMKIVLQNVTPPIWRRIQVRSDITLDELRDVIEDVFDWSGFHMHYYQFSPALQLRADMYVDVQLVEYIEESVRLNEVVSLGSHFVYYYDFDDGWEHLIEVEQVIPFQPSVTTPYCLEGKYASPPENCGGPRRYEEMLEILAGPDSAERREWLVFLGPVNGCDHNEFNLRRANENLMNVTTRRQFVHRGRVLDVDIFKK